MFEAMDLTADPGLSIVAYTAEPNSHTESRSAVNVQLASRFTHLEMSAEHADGTDLK